MTALVHPKASADADRAGRTIYEACAFIAEAPYCGRIRNELTFPPYVLPVRTYPNYLVICSPTTAPLPIIRILLGKRTRTRIFAMQTE